MLKNGRLLVVVLAAGVALATTAPARAETVAKAPGGVAAAKGQRKRTALQAATVQQMTIANGRVSIKIGADTFDVARSHVRIVDRRTANGQSRFKRSRATALEPGTAVAYRVMRAADGSVARMRLIAFDSLAAAQTRVARP